MSNPPPFNNISGISRVLSKDNAQESVANYDGNARPGEIVINLTNNDVYIGDVSGELQLISTGGGGSHADPAGPVGSVQLNAGGNLFTGSANLTFVNNTLTTGNIIPATDNTYFLGNSTNRWANIWLGPGTLYITDSNIAANTTAELTVLDGVLQVNGADQLQVGQLKFVNNNIESITSSVDIQIGLTASTGKLKLQRDVIVDSTKTLTYQYAVGYQDGNQNPIEVLDQTKQVHTFADGTWALHDGVDGKVLHFVMLSGGSAEDIYIRVSHLRKIVGGQDTTVNNVLFRPFPYGAGTSFNTVTTMVFANGAWHPSQGMVV